MTNCIFMQRPAYWAPEVTYRKSFSFKGLPTRDPPVLLYPALPKRKTLFGGDR